MCQIGASAEFRLGSLGLAQSWVLLVFFSSLYSVDQMRTSPVSVHAVAIFMRMTEMNMINETESGKIEI